MRAGQGRAAAELFLPPHPALSSSFSYPFFLLLKPIPSLSHFSTPPSIASSPSSLLSLPFSPFSIPSSLLVYPPSYSYPFLHFPSLSISSSPPSSLLSVLFLLVLLSPLATYLFSLFAPPPFLFPSLHIVPLSSPIPRFPLDLSPSSLFPSFLFPLPSPVAVGPFNLIVLSCRLGTAW